MALSAGPPLYIHSVADALAHCLYINFEVYISDIKCVSCAVHYKENTL